MAIEEKNNLLEKLGIVTPKPKDDMSASFDYDTPAPKRKKASASSTTGRRAAASKTSSDDLSTEYEEMLKQRATKATAKKVAPARKAAPKATAAPAPEAHVTRTRKAEPVIAPIETAEPTTIPTPSPRATAEYTPVSYAPEPYIPEETAYHTPNYADIAEYESHEETDAEDTAATSIGSTNAPEETGYYNTETYNAITDLYAQFGKESGGVGTVFIIDAFIKTLPESLAEDVKRSSVLNILNVSNINVNHLINDGVSRMEILSNFANAFSEYTGQVTTTREQQITVLEEQVKALKREISERNRLQDKQQATIDAEVKEIRKYLDFVQVEKR
jgi:hypothetical protein